MPLDDAARVRRLREAPRTDITLGERMGRFCVALQRRIRKSVESLDEGGGVGVDESPLGASSAWTIQGGAVFADGRVEVIVRRGRLPDAASIPPSLACEPGVVTGLRVSLRPADALAPPVWFGLWHVGVGPGDAPDDQWFGGAALLAPTAASEDAARFLDVWKQVCDRYDPAAYDRFRQEASARIGASPAEPAYAGGLLFDGLREDPEGAFHLVRECGRAFPAAYLPLVPPARARGEAEGAPAPRPLESGQTASREIDGVGGSGSFDSIGPFGWFGDYEA